MCHFDPTKSMVFNFFFQFMRIVSDTLFLPFDKNKTKTRPLTIQNYFLIKLNRTDLTGKKFFFCTCFSVSWRFFLEFSLKMMILGILLLETVLSKWMHLRNEISLLKNFWRGAFLLKRGISRKKKKNTRTFNVLTMDLYTDGFSHWTASNLYH